MLVELNGLEFHVSVSRPAGSMTMHIADEGFRGMHLSAPLTTPDDAVTLVETYAGLRTNRQKARAIKHFVESAWDGAAAPQQFDDNCWN